MYGPTGLAKGTFTEYDDLFQLAKELANLPSEGEKPARFTSVCINVDFSASLHVDSRNEGPSWIIAGGGFEGGELFVEDAEGDAEITLDEADAGVRTSFYGITRASDVIRGHCHDVRHKFLSFDGSRLAHKVLPFKGSRLSFVYFNNDKGSRRDLALLNAWGMGPQLEPRALAYRVVIPSSKRRLRFFTCTLPCLLEQGIPLNAITLFCDAEDFRDYYEDACTAGISIQRGASGLPAQRRISLASVPLGEWVASMDDDVCGFHSLRGNLHQAILHGFAIISERDLSIFGANVSMDPRNLRDSCNFSNGLINGYFLASRPVNTCPKMCTAMRGMEQERILSGALESSPKKGASCALIIAAWLRKTKATKAECNT